MTYSYRLEQKDRTKERKKERREKQRKIKTNWVTRPYLTRMWYRRHYFTLLGAKNLSSFPQPLHIKPIYWYVWRVEMGSIVWNYYWASCPENRACGFIDWNEEEEGGGLGWNNAQWGLIHMYTPYCFLNLGGALILKSNCLVFLQSNEDLIALLKT